MIDLNKAKDWNDLVGTLIELEPKLYNDNDYSYCILLPFEKGKNLFNITFNRLDFLAFYSSSLEFEWFLKQISLGTVKILG